MSSQPFRMKDYISPPNDLLTDMCAFSWLLRCGQYSPPPPPYAHDSYMSNWDSSRDPRDIHIFKSANANHETRAETKLRPWLLRIFIMLVLFEYVFCYSKITHTLAWWSISAVLRVLYIGQMTFGIYQLRLGTSWCVSHVM